MHVLLRPTKERTRSGLREGLSNRVDSGSLLATYTGVLIGATAIPAWFLHRTQLPIHFGTAGLGCAAALLELLGHRIAALNFLGFYAAGIETALLIWLSVDKHGAADRAITSIARVG